MAQSAEVCFNTAERHKVAQWQAKQREHVAANDLTRQYERERVYNKSGTVRVITSGIATRANKLYNTGSESGNIAAFQRDQPIRDKLQSADTVKAIDMNAQDAHIAGTKRYQDRADKLKRANQYGPSRLDISPEAAQALVSKYVGTGVLTRSKKTGTWLNEEVITTNESVVGTVVHNLTGKEAQTSVFKIKYGPGGTHIVPDYPSKKGAKGK